LEVEIDPRKRGYGKTTVLVVDDSAAIRNMVASAFLSEGFRIFVAENGRQGIEAAKQCKPDVIILDLSMPVMDGLQSAPELRRFLPKTPIILFTSYAQGLLQTEAPKLR